MKRNLLYAKMIAIVFFSVSSLNQVTAKNFAVYPDNITLLETQLNNKKVTLNLKNKPVTYILNQIQKQSDIDFGFSERVDPKTMGNFSITVNEVSVNQALSELFKNSQYTYKISGDKVVIDSKPVVTGRANNNVKSEKFAVKGKVIDTSNKPIVGATVIVLGTTTGAISDENGVFSLEATAGQMIEASFAGCKKSIVMASKEEMIIKLTPDVMEVDEVVVIGYGKSTKKDLTGSVHHIDGKLFEESAASDIGRIIQGQVPGMYVLAGTGAPGSAVQMQIRGISSIRGNIQPLIVLDNVPMPDSFDIGTLNPKDIQSIDVLTDASATAIYGSRASAGVIIITTRRGIVERKPRISYSFSHGLEQLTSKINVLSPEEFKFLLMEAVRNSAIESGIANIDRYIGYQTVMAPGFFGESNTEWMKLLMQNSYKQSHSLSLSGGSPASRYMVSMGYNNEKGQVIGTGMKRYTMSLNLDNRITKWLNMGISLKGNIGDTDNNQQSLMSAATARPDLPAYNPDGSYYIHKYDYAGTTSYLQNPLVELSNEDNRKNYGLFGSAYLTVDILKNLSFRATYSMDYTNDHNRQYYPSNSYSGSNGYKGGKGRLTENRSNSLKNEAEATLSFNQRFNKHYFDAVLGGNFIRNHRNDYTFSFSGFSDDYIQTGIWQGATLDNKTGNDRGNVMLSGFFRINYNFNSRYYFTASIRADGSSSFARNNRYGVFPAVAVAWNLAEEKFMKENVKFVNMFKFRASWGKTGMASIGDYGWRTLFQSTSYLDQPAFIPRQLGNDNLKWESTTQTNLAVDFSFFKGYRLTGTFSYYNKDSKDVLYPFTPAPSMGITSNATVNLASINNKGWEFNINGKIIDNKNFKFELGFNVSRNVNKITGLGREYASSLTTSSLSNTVIKEGGTLGLFYGYRTDGIFQSWEEIYACEALNKDFPYQGDRYTKTSPGDIKFKDLDGDGRVNMDYNRFEDKEVLGSSVPDFTGGMNLRITWKGLSLSAQGTYSYGYMKSWDGEGRQFVIPYNNPTNVMNFALERWTPDNPNAKYPKVKVDNKLANQFSDFYLHDASFFKLQNISLSYRIPDKLVSKLKIFESLDISFSANNLFIITKYPGPSPESFSANRIQGAAIDYSVYPSTRVYNFGIRLTL